MKIKGKPDVSQFLDGGAVEKSLPPEQKATGKAEKQTQAALSGPKRPKLVELPQPIFDAIKDRAYEDYKKTGKRVTDTEIIVSALAKYLNVDL